MQLIEKSSESVDISRTETRPNWIVRFDTDRRHLFVCDDALDIYCAGREQIIGKSHRETNLFDPLLCNHWEDIIRKVIDTGATWQGKSEWRRDGKKLELVIKLIPELDKTGNLVSVLGILHDDSVLLTDDDELISSKLRYKAILGASPDGITITDIHGNISMVSPAVIKLHGGGDLSHFVGKNISDFIHPDDRERAGVKISRMFQGIFDGPEEYRIISHNGTTYNVEINADFIKDVNGDPSGLVFVLREITRRKEMEEALRDSEEIFAQFLEYSPIYVFFKDKDIRSLRLSRNFENMLGRPLDDLIGKTMMDLFPSDFAKKMVEDDLKVLSEGKQIEIEEEFNDRQYTTIKFPIYKDGKPQFLAGYSIDVTENKKASKVLKQKANELKRFNNLMLGREMRMIELKKEINDLLKEAGKNEKYNIH